MWVKYFAMCYQSTGIQIFILTLCAVMVKMDEENPILDSPSSCEIGNMLHSLLTPTEMHSLQVQALRQDLFRILKNSNLDPSQNLDDVPEETKRSVSSLARTGALPFNKRNVEALARGGLLKVPNDELEALKRSIATLAKNGQLPNYSIPEESEDQVDEDEETKRSIEAMARNGYLNNKHDQINELVDSLLEKRNLASLARGFNLPPNGKRNIGALARDYNFPVYGKRFLGSIARGGSLRYNSDNDKRSLSSIVRNGKRNIAALIRNNDWPLRNDNNEWKRNIASLVRGGGFNSARYNDKRNAAALLRQSAYKNGDGNSISQSNDEDNETSKRSLASLKAQIKQKRSTQDNASSKSPRSKRSIDYSENEEYSVPVYQNENIHDYEDLMDLLSEDYPNPDKRFLGSVARSGWFRSPGSGSPSSNQYVVPEKRHIGSLARLGWLPAFRSVRSRFSRSGRSDLYDNAGFKYRTNPPNGPQTKINPANSDGPLEVRSSFGNFVAPIPSAKRYLLFPAVDSLLLRKMHPNPKISRFCSGSL